MTSGKANRDVREPPGGLSVGARLGKYEIVQRLGVGGQSIVYKGYDPLLERHVAIKQVAPHLAADERFIERFREVARQLAKLGCEEVVTIHDLIEEPQGLFVVMEFVEGHTIETTLSDSAAPVEPRAVLQIVWRVAAGLAAIHKAGVIHRDVKPGNIIVGEGLRVKITDFGVAARAGTRASMRLGTTRYMAPELFAGQDVDQRADIYSLGMIAYEMLLGRAKFNEVFRDIVRDPHGEALRWMKWHSSEESAPPLTELNPEVPPALSDIVARMMAKDPRRRYENVEALGRDIRANFSPRAQRPASGRRKRRVSVSAAADAEGRVLAGNELSEGMALPEAGGAAGEPKTAEIPKEPMSLAKKLAIAGTIAGLLLAGLVGHQIFQAVRRREVRRQALLAYGQGLDRYREAARAEDDQRKSELFKQAKEQCSEVARRYWHQARTVGEQAQVHAWLAQSYGLVLAGDYKAAEQAYAQADKAVRRLERDERSLYEWTQDMRNELGALEAFRTRVQKFRQAMADAERARDADDLARAQKILETRARPEAKSPAELARVAAMLQSVEVEQRQEEYRGHRSRGDALAEQGNVEEALAAWDEALRVLDKTRDRLSDKDYNELKQKVESRKVALTIRTDCLRALAAARKIAKLKGQQLEAAAAFRKVAAKVLKAKELLSPEDYKGLVALADPAKLKSEGDTVEHDYWLEKGYEALGAGRTKPAEDFFQRAKKVKDSPRVQQALAEIEKKKSYYETLRSAEKLYAEKSYEAALEAFAKALKFRDADRKHIQSRQASCNYYIHLAKAAAARSERKWEEARRSYLRAKQFRPSAGDTINALLDQLTRERVFAELMDAAERAIAKKAWSEAVTILLDAKKARPRSTEVEARLKDVRYWQAMEMGDTAMAGRDYRAAVAYYRQAKRYKATPEVDGKLQQAEDALKAEGDGE